MRTQSRLVTGLGVMAAATLLSGQRGLPQRISCARVFRDLTGESGGFTVGASKKFGALNLRILHG